MAWANSSLQVVGCPLYDPNPPSQVSSTRSLAHDIVVVRGSDGQRRGKPGGRFDSNPQRSDNPKNRPQLSKQPQGEADRGPLIWTSSDDHISSFNRRGWCLNKVTATVQRAQRVYCDSAPDRSFDELCIVVDKSNDFTAPHKSIRVVALIFVTRQLNCPVRVLKAE